MRLVNVRLERMPHLKEKVAGGTAVRSNCLPRKGELPEPAGKAWDLEHFYLEPVLPRFFPLRAQAEDRDLVTSLAQGEGKPVQVPFGSTALGIPNINGK